MIFDSIAERVGRLLLGRAKFDRLRYKRAQRAGWRNGYELYKPNLTWLKDAGFRAVLDNVTRLKIDGIANDRCFTLYELARKTATLPGDIAECGVRYGKSSHFILGGFGETSKKRFHAFDSFEGLSAPTDLDLDASGKSIWAKGQLMASEDIVRRNLAKWSDRLVLHKGWIPEKFYDVKDNQFSFVHIDVDLHQPTRDSLAFFYPRMTKGGVIVCDDYGFVGCEGATLALDEFFAGKPETVFSLTTGQSLVIKS